MRRMKRPSPEIVGCHGWGDGLSVFRRGRRYGGERLGLNMAGKKAQEQQSIVERRAEVARLRLSGVRNQRSLAALLGVSLGTINGDFKALDKEWKDAALTDTDAHKAVQNERYEALISAHWEKALEGKGFDTDRVLAAMAQQAKLLGIDAPAKSDVNLGGSMIREYVIVTDDVTAPEDGD